MSYNDVLVNRFHNENEYGGDLKQVNKQTPIVSVIIATYQQKNYIAQCIEGVLMQQTNFIIEIIIGEDHSTDGTREICIKYAEKYPDKIRLFLRDRSQSQYYENDVFISRFNGIWSRMSARGKYVAFCEGDDYWIDPFKLQKQVSFLEENKDYSMCFHNAFVENLYSLGKVSSFPIKSCTNTFTTKELFRNKWFIPTASIVCKTKYLPHNIEELKYLNLEGDMLIQLAQSKYGKIYCLREFMSVYRFGTPSSLTKQNSKNPLKPLRKFILLLDKINTNFFDDKYSNEVNYRRVKYYLSVIKYYLLRLFRV